jgi:hypothetical protein
MKELPKLNRVVVVSTDRKHGNGAVGGGRQGTSGKKAKVYQKYPDKDRKLLLEIEAPTFSALSKELHKPGRVPNHIPINKKGETNY